MRNPNTHNIGINKPMQWKSSIPMFVKIWERWVTEEKWKEVERNNWRVVERRFLIKHDAVSLDIPLLNIKFKAEMFSSTWRKPSSTQLKLSMGWIVKIYGISEKTFRNRASQSPVGWNEGPDPLRLILFCMNFWCVLTCQKTCSWRFLEISILLVLEAQKRRDNYSF